jgi:hypothetical protein
MRIVMLILVLCISFPAIAEECDCNIYPFLPEPPCWSKCTAERLAEATAKDLVEIAKFNPQLAQMIGRIPESERPKTLGEYEGFLPERAFNDLKKTLKGLSDYEFIQLRKAAANRESKTN